MRIPEIRSKGLNTTGLTGIVLMVLHLTNMINGWGGFLLYCFNIKWNRTRIL